jgi:hypothetical protein
MERMPKLSRLVVVTVAGALTRALLIPVLAPDERIPARMGG